MNSLFHAFSTIAPTAQMKKKAVFRAAIPSVSTFARPVAAAGPTPLRRSVGIAMNRGGGQPTVNTLLDGVTLSRPAPRPLRTQYEAAVNRFNTSRPVSQTTTPPRTQPAPQTQPAPSPVPVEARGSFWNSEFARNHLPTFRRWVGHDPRGYQNNFRRTLRRNRRARKRQRKASGGAADLPVWDARRMVRSPYPYAGAGIAGYVDNFIRDKQQGLVEGMANTPWYHRFGAMLGVRPSIEAIQQNIKDHTPGNFLNRAIPLRNRLFS